MKQRRGAWWVVGGMLCVALVGFTAHDVQRNTRNPSPFSSGDSTKFVVHGDHLRPGGIALHDTTALRNPFEGDTKAIELGSKLFVSYNCVDCHGADGSGAMGPALMDGRWHFGGSAAEVYESIAQGRPDGMPAWGGLLDRNSIWRLVSYVRSLEKGKDVATENFSGKTVERTGH
jgi:hypothetical protein